MNISTKRLTLRPFTLSDLKLLYHLHSNPTVMKYIPSGIRTMEETWLDLHDDIAHQENHGFSKWAVFLKDTGDFIGRAGWASMDTTGEVEVGFKFFPQYWGNGFATEVLQALLAWGKANIQRPLIAFADPENNASIEVLRKSGMIYLRQDEYEGKTIVVYSLSQF
ncbi:GNAT family N-acetyltransferase [Legionella taurinensis]|uniref:GNAT family N-acetyltransferase n=1 Tax=Legionella taurinensis TaxID=70611 RepID=A0A3A5LRK5_9GAMM|nr:GNAT family N-acetyltransferase [Legionella taurinensis]RJT46899.1 GNAT family N-acetyltransferase [Legionella taurinensis]RJT66900.1 GNAT family N-acetyltransferase [Legionella taurinensis]